jgi:hypothetical protein
LLTALTEIITSLFGHIVFTIAASLAAYGVWLGMKNIIWGTTGDKKAFTPPFVLSLAALLTQPNLIFPAITYASHYTVDFLIYAAVLIPVLVISALRMRKPKKKVEITNVGAGSISLRVVKKLPFLNNWADAYAQTLYTGPFVLGFNPYAESARALFGAFVSLIVILPVVILLDVLRLVPVFLTAPFLTIVLIFVLYPYLKLRLSYSERSKRLEDELPLAILYASLVEQSSSLYESFKSLLGKKVFPVLEKEAEVIEKHVVLGGMSQDEAYELLASKHPSRDFALILNGYTSIRRTGGSTALYLEAQADNLLEFLESKWSKVADTTATAGEAAITMFFLLPSLFLVGGLVLPSMTGLFPIITLMLPVMAILFYVMLAQAQPTIYDVVKVNPLPGLFTGGLVFAALVASNPLWLTMSMSIAAAALVYGLESRRIISENHAIDKAVPLFLEQMSEYAKMGLDIINGLIRCAHENSYTPAFDRLLANAANQLALGVPPRDLEIRTGSWTAKYTFFLLGESSEVGAISPYALRKAAQYVDRVLTKRKEASAANRMYLFLAYGTPIGLVGLDAMMVVFTPTIGVNVPSNIGNFKSPITFVPITPATLQSSFLLAMMVGISLAVVTTRASSFSLKNTIHIAGVAIAVSAAILVLYVLGIGGLSLG